MIIKYCILIFSLFFLNSCCSSIFEEQTLSINKFEYRIQNRYTSTDFYIIFNISNYSSCDPVDYFEREFTDTTYILLENKNQKYFEIIKYVDFKICSEEKLGIIEREYKDIFNLINNFKQNKNNLELKNYYDKNINHNPTLTQYYDYNLIIKDSSYVKIDNCNFNNSNGLYLLKNIFTIISKNINK